MYLKHSAVGIYYKGSIAVPKTVNAGSIPTVPVTKVIKRLGMENLVLFYIQDYIERNVCMWKD